jgi:hypothetical protein
MSNPTRQTAPMILYSFTESDNATGSEVIARFGNAEIIASLDGKFEIKGGSTEERKQAGQWAARFLDVRFSTRELLAA